jgi:hypothetical protein
VAVVIPFPKRTDWEPWLSKRELSSILGFGTRWIEYRVSEGMPSRKIGGRCMFRLSEVEQWCRLNEGLNLEHRDLRPREREVDLRVTKFSKPRTVLLLPEAWDAIRTIPRQAKHERVWYAKSRSTSVGGRSGLAPSRPGGRRGMPSLRR